MAVTTWIDDTILQDAVAKEIGLGDRTSLPSRWTTICTSANQNAYKYIIRKLVAQNWSIAQINTWMERVEFNTDIGLFFALYKGGAMSDKPDQYIRSMDRRKELEDMIIIDDTMTALTPAGTVEDQVVSGDLNKSAYPMSVDTEFTFSKSMAPGYGEPGNFP